MGLDVIKLQTNVPEVIALEFAVGKPVTSQFGGDQVMFSTTDGRRLYLPPFVADKIHNARITPKTPFAICKREVTHGNRRSVEYQIETPNENATGSPERSPAALVGSQNRTTTPTALSQSQQPATHVTNGGGNIPPSVPPTVEGSAIALLASSGRAAIDAVLATEEYAKQRGLTDFAFGAENIQKVWMALYIELNRKGART